MVGFVPVLLVFWDRNLLLGPRNPVITDGVCILRLVRTVQSVRASEDFRHTREREREQSSVVTPRKGPSASHGLLTEELLFGHFRSPAYSANELRQGVVQQDKTKSRLLCIYNNILLSMSGTKRLRPGKRLIESL
jgi:hypothetical protein